MTRSNKTAMVVMIALVAAIVAWRVWPRGTPSGVTAGPGVGSAKLAHTGKQAASSNPATLSGHVNRKADGAGVAGAVVALSEGDMFSNMTNDSPTIVVTTDANGAWTAPKVPPGAYMIAATATGYLPTTAPKLWIAAGEQRTGIELAMEAGGTLVRGTVTDIGGGAIAAARVSVHDDSRFEWQRAELIAITGADGAYQLSLPDGDYEATASHDEYTHVSHALEVASKPVTLDFVLTPGAVVRGQVIAKDTNKPVPHAMVSVSHRQGRDGGGDPDGMTDDDGNFAIKSLRPGVLALTASGRGYASVAPTTVAVGIGEQVDGVRILVDRAFTISGRVVKQGTKDGIPGVRVGAFSMAQGRGALDPDPSDADGKFEIFGVRPASYMLFALGEGSVPEVGKSVEIVDKDVTGIELELQTGVTITGKVDPPQIAAISLGLAGEVGLANLFEAAKTMAVHGDSDAQGNFTLHNVPTGALKITARATSGSTGSTPIVVAKIDQHDVLVHLEVRATVSGKVIDTNSAPVVGATVTAESTEEQHTASISFNGSSHNTAKTAVDGSFKIVGLEAGKYKLVASQGRDEMMVEMMERYEKDKSKDRKKPPVEVELAAGAERTGVTITVEAHDGVIRGLVIGSDKKPAADTWVTARVERELPKEAGDDAASFDPSWQPTSEPVLTTSDGKFTIAKLRRGTYTVIADGPRGSSRAEKPGVKTGDSVTIELQPLGTLTGHVMLKGAPVTTYSIECRGPAGPIDRSASAADGAYSLEHLAPGAYTCKAESDAGTANGKVDVPAGTATLELALVPWASLTGLVVSMFSGAPVANIHVLTGGMDGQSMAAIVTGTGPKTDTTGHFLIDKVASGSGQLMVMDASAGFKPLATRSYNATDGQRVDVGTIKIVPPRQGDAGTFGLVVTSGEAGDAIVVTSVKPGGPAEAAGVKVDDKIKTIDGKTVTELTPMQAALFLSSGQVGVGEVVQLGLERDGQPVQATVTSVKW